MNNSLYKISKILEKDLKTGYHVNSDFNIGLASRGEIYSLLDKMLAVLFPGCYCNEKIPEDEMVFFIEDALREITLKLSKHIRDVLSDESEENNIQKAFEAVSVLIEQLPEIRKALLEDIKTAYNGDPAAKSLDEIVLSYPCIDAIATYRIAHTLYKLEIPVIPRIMSERSHSRTGIDIHPGAQIQPGFFIDHGTGVVIGETCKIGKNVILYQGVTLGALSPFDKKGNPLRGAKRHPDIEDNVIIYANATILGGNTIIGKGSIIGGNCWVTESIPPGTIVYNKNEIKMKNN
ncbi:MAG: serine acetyltransferase [Spirochaetales bacterium]|nr:serine acetyltransferase [Spirochaetales bacterium]